MKKVSGKTHTQKQLDDWANQHNPNNRAYQSNRNNQTNQIKTNSKTHQAIHNARRRYKDHLYPDWAPDYPEYDD